MGKAIDATNAPTTQMKQITTSKGNSPFFYGYFIFISLLLIAIGGTLTGAGYILTSQVDSIWYAYAVLGGVVGIGISSVVVPLNVTLSRWFIKRRAMVTGIVLAGTGIGSFIIPPLA